MSNVAELMLSRFAVLYGEPRSPDIAKFFAEYERALRGTRPDIIEAATDAIVRAHDRKSWPTPGECVKAVQVAAEVKSADARRAAPTQAAPVQWKEPSEESKRRVREMVARLTASLQAGKRDESKPTLPAVNRDAWRARYGQSYTSRMLGERDE